MTTNAPNTDNNANTTSITSREELLDRLHEQVSQMEDAELEALVQLLERDDTSLVDTIRNQTEEGAAQRQQRTVAEAMRQRQADGWFSAHDIRRPEWLGQEWEDTSYGNDACASARLRLLPEADTDEHNVPVVPTVCVWVNYDEDREVPDKYFLEFEPVYGDAATDRAMPLYGGDDEDTARKWAEAAVVAATVIQAVRAEPRLYEAADMAELHSVCDANMLGKQAEYAEAHGGAGSQRTADVLNMCSTIVDYWMDARAKGWIKHKWPEEV